MSVNTQSRDVRIRSERVSSARSAASRLGPLAGLMLATAAMAACTLGSAKFMQLGPTGGSAGGAAAGGMGGTDNAGGSGAGTGGSGVGTGGSGVMTGPNMPPVTTPTIPVPSGGMPATDGATMLQLPPAPAMPGTVNYLPDRSSVRLYLPGVSGARDYRVFAVEDGVAVSVKDNREHVDGATIHCAGLRQRNQCDDGEVLPIKYNNETLDLPACEIDPSVQRRPNVPTALMQTLEVDGIKPNTTLVVEAIDRQCPFPGIFGSQHTDYDVAVNGPDFGGPMAAVVVNGKSYNLQRMAPKYSVFTEAEIRAAYGSMIFNGQGPNLPTLDPKSPAFPESPYIRIAQPAPPDDPVVLARAVIKVSPTGTSTLPDGFTDQDYFDDFEDPSDQVTFLRSNDYTEMFVGHYVNVYQSKKWIFYDVHNGISQFFIDRGQLNMVQGDPAQDAMTVQSMYPKRPVHLPTAPDQFLHVTYEVQRIETARRYENLTLCGSDTVGQTYDGEAPKAAPLPHPGFMNEDDTARTNVLGWNCLLLIPRGGGYDVIPGGDIKSHSDTSLKITVVRTQPPPAPADYDAKHVTAFATAFGPTQEAPYPRRWMRQVDGNGMPSGMWLDDQMNVWQKTRFDVFIRRDRVVIYVEGQQRVCQDLTASPLTMAEGALGFWHVLYHTSAEFDELRAGGWTSDPFTGMHHILHNTPWADVRSYDNVGFRENVALPANFDPSRCYKGN